MKFIKAKNYEELSQIAGEIIAKQIKEKPTTVLGLATGSSPVGTYKYLIDNKVDFSKVKTVNLDEYVGLDGTHEQSYRRFMNENLFDHVNIDKKNTYVPNGVAKDLAQETKAYDQRIEDFGGIDLQVLGIGIDGHIGFNEPEDCFTAETHVVTLDPSTIEANARFFSSKDEVPKQALTMGMKGIMTAKKIVLVANGKNKKEILEKAMYGKITPFVPASILQLHNDITIIFSEE
jgi:glucosamine-6-phosphate deaminase